MSRGTTVSIAIGVFGGILLLAFYPGGIPERIILTLLIGGGVLIVAPWALDRLAGKPKDRDGNNRR